MRWDEYVLCSMRADADGLTSANMRPIGTMFCPIADTTERLMQMAMKHNRDSRTSMRL